MTKEIKEYLDSANFRFKDVDENGNETELTLSEEIENLIDNNKKLADYIINLQTRIDKAIEILHSLNDTLPLDLILSEIEHSEYILQGENNE